MKTLVKPTVSPTKAQSLIELVNQHVPDGKFKGIMNLLEPHEQPHGGTAKNAKRS